MIGDTLQFLKEIRQLFESFGDAGYLHLLMEPLFTYGIGFSLLLYVVAIASGENRCRTLALLLIILCSIFVYPYQHKRNEAAPAWQPMHGTSWTPDDQELWEAQTRRRSNFQYLYYLLAIGALLNIVLPFDGGLLGKLLTVGVLGGCAGVLTCGLWLNLHEKRIFHPEIRQHHKRDHRQFTQIEHCTFVSWRLPT